MIHNDNNNELVNNRINREKKTLRSRVKFVKHRFRVAENIVFYIHKFCVEN